MKRQTDRVHTMPLICRGIVALALEDMAQMATAVTTHDLRPLHTERVVCVSGDGTGDTVEIGRPAAARLEFVVCRVERRVATGAVVGPARWLVLVVLAGEGGFGAFFAQDTELFCRGKMLSPSSRTGCSNASQMR